jgi:nitrogen fixation-related uncharacterized protein
MINQFTNKPITMTTFDLFLIACAVLLFPVVILAGWTVIKVKQMDDADEKAFAEKYNEVSDQVKTAARTPENFDKIRMMITGLKGMRGREKEPIQVLQTEFYRQFSKIHLQRYIDNPDRKKRQAEKIAEREMMEL